MSKQQFKNYAFLTMAITLVSVALIGVVSAAPNLEGNNQNQDQNFFKNRSQNKGLERVGLTEEQKVQMEERKLEMEARHQKVLEAIENNNYSAWVEAVGGCPMKVDISEEDFPKLVAMHKAIQNKDFDTAKTLRDELDLNGFGMGGMMNKNRGYHKMGPGMKFQDKNGDGICDFSEQK